MKNHKTCKTFGHAIVPVTKKEYKCMSEFQKLRNKFEGSHSAHFFLNKNGGLYKGLLKAFTKVWVHMGLSKPAPTFMALRTSMSTQVSVNYDIHTHTLFLSRSLSHTLSQTHTHSHIHTHTHTHTHTNTFSNTLSLTHTHTFL